MVRLKQVYFYRHQITNPESQFHYGSIKTAITVVFDNCIVVRSQFHYGSIKTLIKYQKS